MIKKEDMPDKKEENEVKLKVAEAMQDDVGKGIVNIDTSVMKELKISPGDVVEITGGRTTVAIAERAYPADLGLNIIRMDGLTRWNSKSSLGEFVKVKKVDFKRAQSITLAPASKGINVHISPDLAKNSLLGRALIKGDILTLGGTRRRRRTFSGSDVEDIFRMFEEEFQGIRMGFGEIQFGLGDIRFVVVNTIPKGAVIITPETKVSVSSEAVDMAENKVPEISYEDIGGLGQELTKIREMVEIPLKHPEIFEKLGIEPPKGVLLFGPPGTGKTLLAKAVANETDAHFISIAGPEIMSKWVGEAEKKLRDIFDEAEKNAPSIIFIDEIDAIAPKREEVVGEVERRVVAQLLSIMDGLKSRGKVIVIAATNRPNDIDPALRRPGRFDREIEIGVPDRDGRLDILKIHTRNMPLAEDVNLEKLADVTHGFVGADLAALSKEAAMNLIRRLLPDFKLKNEEQIEKLLEKLIVTMEDFKEALKLVRPSIMREVLIEVPKIGWSDVGGLDDVKQQLKESVEWPLKYPEAFQKIGIKAPKGILLMGPPGCGKTLLAKAVAKESEANFISIKGPEIMSKWVGESEKAIRNIFRRARQASPCIIFFDEIDAIAPMRGIDSGNKVTEQVIAQLLTEMDGLEDLSDVVVIAATNRPDIIDSALLRPGRLDRMIVVGAPDKKARLDILKVHTKLMPIELSKQELEEINEFYKKENQALNMKDLSDKDKFIYYLADKTEGFSGADLENLVREAGILALRDDIKATKVSKKYFDKALETVKPSITKNDVDLYKKFMDKFKTVRNEMAKINYLG